LLIIEPRLELGTEKSKLFRTKHDKYETGDFRLILEISLDIGDFHLISIRKTGDELERLEEFGRSAVTCYSEAIHSASHYAIEFNTEQVANFRSQLQALMRQLRDAGNPDQLKSFMHWFLNLAGWVTILR
jgi:hypothetical protein